MPHPSRRSIRADGNKKTLPPAVLGPARRVLRLHPTDALREE